MSAIMTLLVGAMIGYAIACAAFGWAIDFTRAHGGGDPYPLGGRPLIVHAALILALAGALAWGASS